MLNDFCEIIMADGEPCGLPTDIYEGRVAMCVLHATAKDNEKFQSIIKIRIDEGLKNSGKPYIDFTRVVFLDFNFESFKEFNKPLIFKGAKFEQDVSFASCRFLCSEIDFSDTVFEGNANFTHTGFIEGVSFINSVFKSEAIFQNTKFQGERTLFVGTRFEGNKTFFGEAEFLSEQTQFRDAHFKGNTFFHRATFRGDCTSFAKFSTETVFGGEITRFYESKFLSKATYFSWVKFDSTKETNFDGAIFHGEVIDFSHAEFKSENVTLRDTSFKSLKEYIHFQNCWFKGLRTLFHDTKFESSKVDFHESVFDNAVDFKRNHEKNTAPMFEQGASIRDVLFLSPEKTTFRHVNLSQVELQGTDLRKINFIAVEWPRYPRLKIGRLEKTRLRGVFDEQLLIKQHDPSPDEVELVRSEYRQLKQNYDEATNYYIADQFYFGEMEITRHSKKKWKRLFSWNGLYRFSSGYGLLWTNSLATLCLALIIYSIMFMFSGLKIPSENGQPKRYINYDLSLNFPELKPFAEDWLQCFHYAALSLVPLKNLSGDYEPDIDTRYIVIANSITVPTLVTLFILALRRRFKR
ncbi:MAG: pentapeptide repeat-containing protein [Ignavibacteriae bacterium]|nr:pentapeptide repeat-containing protein [Ignavibacteria bacterium]MBI3365837.1 pentapeptide repeat-containing protein [Ignavibacteriota bacterium]